MAEIRSGCIMLMWARVMISNTDLPTGGGRMTKFFMDWRNEISQQLPGWEMVIQASTVSNMSDDVLAAYEAPFPTEEHRAGSRKLPQVVPVFDDMPSVAENMEAWRFFPCLFCQSVN